MILENIFNFHVHLCLVYSFIKIKNISNEHIKFDNFVFKCVNIQAIFLTLPSALDVKEKSLNAIICEGIEHVAIVFQGTSIEVF